MKIAQYTFNGYDNYGQILQKYALHQVLKQYAQQVDVIWSETNHFWPETWEWIWRSELLKMSASAEARRKFTFNVVRHSKFKAFCERHIRTRFNITEFEDIADEYDYFVVGSDQVWNPFATHFQQRFLQFAPKHKRISYAASIAIPTIPPEWQEFYRQGLLGMAKISVREKDSARVVRELIGLEPLVHIDPAMLLTADQWREVSIRPSWFDERYERGYILSYILRKSVPPIVAEISKRMNLPSVNLLELDVFNHYTTGIDEFLYLIEHATLICTNSFHGTVFSILFGRPFVICNISGDDEGVKVSSRLTTLLEGFGLLDRQTNDQNGFRLDNLLEINYVNRDEVLEHERARSMSFLDDALKGNQT